MALEEEARFFVAFALEIVAEIWVGGFRELGGEIVEAREERHEIWFWIGGGHGFDGTLELEKSVEDLLFDVAHDDVCLSMARKAGVSNGCSTVREGSFSFGVRF